MEARFGTGWLGSGGGFCFCRNYRWGWSPAALFTAKTSVVPCTVKEKPREFAREPYYAGPMLDAHLHLPTTSGIVSMVAARMGLPIPAWNKNLSPAFVQCLLAAEGYERAIGFYLITRYSASGEVAMAKKMEKEYPGKIIPFLMPALVSNWVNPDITTVKNILENNPGFFKGIGELKMYDGKAPDDPYLMALYDLAQKHGLVVMVHPYDRHKESMEKIITQYSDVRFLLHGLDRNEHGSRIARENIRWVTDMIGHYPNVYYSVDHNLSVYGFKKEHVGKTVPKDVILPHARQEFSALVDELATRWKSIISAYPDRFMRGSDRFYAPHYDPEVSGLMAEFSRSFIGRLDPAVQEKFARHNTTALVESR